MSERWIYARPYLVMAPLGLHYLCSRSYATTQSAGTSRSRYDLGSSQTVVVNVDRFYNEATIFALGRPLSRLTSYRLACRQLTGLLTSYPSRSRQFLFAIDSLIVKYVLINHIGRCIRSRSRHSGDVTFHVFGMLTSHHSKYRSRVGFLTT